MWIFLAQTRSHPLFLQQSLWYIVWLSQGVLNFLTDFQPSLYLLIRNKLQFFDWTCFYILFPVNVPLMQNNNELVIQPFLIEFSRSFCKWKCNFLTKIHADIDIHCTFNSHWCRPLAGQGGGTGPRPAAGLSGSLRRCRGPGTSSGARSRCI